MLLILLCFFVDRLLLFWTSRGDDDGVVFFLFLCGLHFFFEMRRLEGRGDGGAVSSV